MSSGKKTKSPYEKFKERCTHWRKLFGINDIIIETTPEFIDASCGSYDYDAQSRTALIKFNDEEDLTSAEIDYMAFHEMRHIFYGDIEAMLESRGYTQDEREQALHRLIIADWKRENP